MEAGFQVEQSTPGSGADVLEQLLARNQDENPPFSSELVPIEFGVTTGHSAISYGNILQIASLRQWNKLDEASRKALFPGEGNEVTRHAQLLRELELSETTDSQNYALLHEVVVMLHLRWVSLAKSSKHEELRQEVQRLQGKVTEFADSPALPSWFPTGLKISFILLFQFVEDPQSCIDRLEAFISYLNSHQTAAEDATQTTEIWISRARVAVANLLVQKSKWRLALIQLDRVIHGLDQQLSIAQDPEEKSTLTEARIDVISRQSRIFLQIGAIDEAQVLIHALESDLATIDKNFESSYQRACTNVLLNKGLLHFAQEQYPRAMEQFSLALEESRSAFLGMENSLNDSLSPDQNSEVHTLLSLLQEQYYTCLIGAANKAGGSKSFMTVLDPPEERFSHVSACLNNMALCALYSCQMRKSIGILESAVQENPSVHLTQALAFNLCTLYELGSDNSTSSRKKRVLETISKHFELHDITAESFRIA